MSENSKAVFLSYASQDAEAARRICDALRTAGVEVWFDCSELRGGDAWDQKIRKQIKDCALFIPIISANTQSRHEGYFRLEWHLAEERSHLIARGRPFIMPVCVDQTRDNDALVPDAFVAVQWTRLAGGEKGEAFAQRVATLLRGSTAPAVVDAGNSSAERTVAKPAPSSRRPWLLAGVAIVLAVAAGLSWWMLRPRASPAATSAPAAEWPRNTSARRAYELFHASNSKKEDFATAEGILDAELTARPNDPELVTVYAQLQNAWLSRSFDLSNERHARARQFSEKAYRLAGPNDPEALFALGRFWQFRDADHARAEDLLRRATALKPDDPNFHAALVNAALARDQAAGLDEARKMAAHFPDHAITQYRVATHFMWSGKIEEGEAALDRSLSLERSSNAVTLKALLAVTVHGDVAAMSRIIATLPPENRFDDRAVYTAYLQACLTDNLTAGIAIIESAPDAWLQDLYFTGPKSLLLGDLLRQQGKRELARLQFEDARAAVARAREKSPADLNLLGLEAWTLWYLDRADEARAAMRPLFERVKRPYRMSPHNIGWFWNPVPQLLLFGERARALELMREAATDAVLRARLRTILVLDPRMKPFRDDAEIRAIIAEPTSAVVVAPTAPIDPKSIAVLPFANLSPDPENAFFCDGVHEDVITHLAKIRDLRVISRTSVMGYRDTKKSPREIAGELGVARILEGSVRRANNRVRITTQLIDAATGQVLWSPDPYDRNLDDIFAIQSEIAEKIAGALQTTLTAGERALIERRPTQNQQAHDLFVLGRSDTGNYTTRIENLEKAVALDPQFTEAWAMLSVWNAHAYWDEPDHERGLRFRERAKTALDTTDRLAPGLPEGRLARADYFYRVERDFERAADELRLAEAGLPNSTDVAQSIAYTARRLGRWSQALDYFERARRLDPANTGNRFSFQLETLHLLRRYAEARALAVEAIAKAPNQRVFLMFEAWLNFSADGDADALERALVPIAKLIDPAAQPAAAWAWQLDTALRRNDWDSAETLLAKPARPDLAEIESSIPVPLLRAEVAWLRGDLEAAKKYADETIAFFRGRAWPPRRAAWTQIGIAQAQAWAGRADDAARDATQALERATREDAFDAILIRAKTGRVLAVLGRREDAFAILRDMMNGPCAVSPNELRRDPIWSRLADDPRFEEILQSAKPL